LYNKRAQKSRLLELASSWCTFLVGFKANVSVFFMSLKKSSFPTNALLIDEYLLIQKSLVRKSLSIINLIFCRWVVSAERL
jgi:hypothetical protein